MGIRDELIDAIDDTDNWSIVDYNHDSLDTEKAVDLILERFNVSRKSSPAVGEQADHCPACADINARMVPFADHTC